MQQDPISDMLTRIRNAQLACKKSVEMPSSKLKSALARVLKKAGYIVDYYTHRNTQGLPFLMVELKYHEGRPVIAGIERISKPSLRIYTGKELAVFMNGFGVVIISTSKGVLSDREARRLGVGGELLCRVY